MPRLIYISHPDVVVLPEVPIPEWSLSPGGMAAMQHFCRNPILKEVTAIVSSTETKATEAAAILADRLGLPVHTDPDMGENDRSATGYLPPDEFEATAHAFFARPDVSVRGWERAIDAQSRICRALDRALAVHRRGDLALVGHGAVGKLLWLALSGLPIARAADQTSPGNYWTASLPGLVPETGWQKLSEG